MLMKKIHLPITNLLHKSILKSGLTDNYRSTISVYFYYG